MICPRDNNLLASVNYKDTNIDICKHCRGMWLDKNELEKIKDETDPFLEIVKVDLWEEKEKMKLEHGEVVCPKDGTPMYKIKYDESGIDVDYCPLCQGIWLDGEEMDKIIDYLKKETDNETVSEYLKNMGMEVKEVAESKESFKEGIDDIWLLAKLIEYKISSKSDFLQSLFMAFPK